MNTLQRQLGRFAKRSADENQVSVLLREFEDAEQLLTRIIDASKAWKESWISILTYQHRLFSEYEQLYAPIIGAADDYQGHQSIETPESILSRATKSRLEYEELKKDLTEEINTVDTSMIRVAQDAKDNLQTFKKTIKKRENKKLDYERYQSRVDATNKKGKAADPQTQQDLTVATEAYNAADDNLRQSLPRILMAVFSLLPHILAAQIQIQNNLLAHYYTMLHKYCTEEGFPSPAPPMDEVIRLWQDSFKPVQQEVESINIIAHGKSLRKSLEAQRTNGHRRPSAQSLSTSSRQQSVSPARNLPPAPASYENTKISTSSSPFLTGLQTPLSDNAVTSPSPPSSAYLTPLTSTPGLLSYAPAAPHTDYFSRDRQPSAASFTANSSSTTLSGLAGKKKPPPPPPRLPSQQFVFVTALYDFGGQGEGDLVFKEGDRIKVVKKTESTEDWWTGELRGVKGAFPANYVK